MVSRPLEQALVACAIALVSACVDDDPGDELATSTTVAAVIAPCTTSQLTAIRAPATATQPEVIVTCSVDLLLTDRITKRLIIEGSAVSGLTIDCHHATIDGRTSVNAGDYMIEIRSRRIETNGVVTWDRPEDVTVRNCNMYGGVKVWGMGVNGEGEDVRLSSLSTGHTQRARDAAPRGTVLDNLIIEPNGNIPIYLSPGVSYTQVRNSELKGSGTSVAMYLDAESYRNTIEGNDIHVSTSSREQLAIDGSSYNTIINNRFSALNHGGIYLYRNCGQGGTVRHATPSNNTIVNNVFYYDVYTGGNPSVYVGARNGNRNYCHLDDGYLFGSSSSNLDHARYNVVMGNQIYKRSVSDMIVVQNASVNSPNYIGHNTTVTEAIDREAGCYVSTGFVEFIADGTTTEVLSGRGSTPTCRLQRCDNGSLFDAGTCSYSTLGYTCSVTGNNAGCAGTVACPAGTRVIGATAACNLEFGTVSAETLDELFANRVSVEVASGNVDAGRCFVGDTSIASGTAVTRGDRVNQVTVGCYEHDSNGGDCYMRGRVFCR